jgi:probable DNA repair protein
MTKLAFDDQTSILTPNRRLAASLHKRYQMERLEENLTCWQTPDILPASTWLQRLWTDYISHSTHQNPLLLNPTQEQFLWEKIILFNKANDRLLQIREAATLAKSAWSLLKQWQIDFEQPIFQSTEDYQALQQWARQFQQWCQEKNWIDAASLPDKIQVLIQNDSILLPKKIILCGFTEYSPQFKHLLSICAAKGTEILSQSAAEQNADCYRIGLEDEAEEILSLARFAKSIYSSEPNATVACVIPNLDKIRDRVRQILTDVFVDTEAFNISAGKSLLDYPVIFTAIQLLQLNAHAISRETFSYLLCSPFLGEAEKERIKRANLDRELRVNNLTTIHLTSSMDMLAKSCPALAKRLTGYFDYLTNLTETLPYASWANIISDILQQLAWPGERSLNSEEYQTIDAWLSLLTEFASLDYVAKPATLTEAVYILKNMANNSIFQAKTPEARIQVLGVLEAAGSPFDYIWVAGLDDMAWPPQPKPNPFIPKKLQRSLHMPHATAERELSFCTLLMQQFKQCANQVIFSHAFSSDELELQASSLIKSLSETNLEKLSLTTYQTPSERIFAVKKIETLIDDQAPPLLESNIRGGVNVIKQQALCPFKAFAEWRLHAHALENPLPGLRPKDRGTLLHKVLELLWMQLKDQASLLNKTNSELQELIDSCIDETLAISLKSMHVRKHYLNLEKQRLQRLVREWLEMEKQRPPFKILATETKTELQINTVKLSTRIDRVDELPNGQKLIIDYKTGKHNEISSWLGDRPDEPQLPLYALLDINNTTGIAFAQLASGLMSFKGLSQYELDIKGIQITASWQEQLNEWKIVLAKLCDDYFAGNAIIDPKEPGETCQWCLLKPLCRIHEIGINDYDN